MKRCAAIVCLALFVGCDEPEVAETRDPSVAVPDSAPAEPVRDAGADARPASDQDASEDAARDVDTSVPVIQDDAAVDTQDAQADAAPPGDASPGNVGASSNVLESVGFTLGKNSLPRPVLLFAGGYACWDASLAAQDPIDAAAHRAAHPEDWAEWRRSSLGVEVKKGASWTPLEYPYEYGPVNEGTTLSGLYADAYSPDPNASPLVALFWRYRFRPDGSFEYCKTSEIIGEYPVFSKERLMRAGTYSVTRYAIQLDFTDGKSERLSFFYDPTESRSLFIGNNYFSPGRDSDSTCF